MVIAKSVLIFFVLGATTTNFVPPLVPFEDTRTPTTTPTVLPTSTPTPQPQPCLGDQNGDHQVTIDELIRAIESSLHGCPP